MAEPPEFWTFVITNLVVFGFGSVLTGLSLYASLAGDRPRSFRTATLGFASLTLGGVLDPIYQLGLKGDYYLGGRELLALQTAEGALIGCGLGLLFYSIYRHNRRGQPVQQVDTY